MARWRTLTALTAAVLILSCSAVPAMKTDKAPSEGAKASESPGSQLIEKVLDTEGLTPQDTAGLGAVIRSLSPTGRSALLWNDEENQAYAVYEGVTSPVLPSADRGAEDTYGKRSMMFNSGLLSNWVGKEGVT